MSAAIQNGRAPGWLRGLSGIWVIAVAVASVGLVLAIIGLIAAGPDQGRRDELHQELDGVRRELAGAESDLRAVATEGRAYAEQGQRTLGEGDEFCGCGRRGRRLQQELEVALGDFLRAPNPSTAEAYERTAGRANAEKVRFAESLLRLRALHSELPPPPAR